MVHFAILGCGRIAGNHLQAIQEVPGAKLAAVCDLIHERADGYSREFGVPAYTDYHRMLLKEPIDVVCVLTPSGMHPIHAMDIMQRYGKHIVVEKPLALRMRSEEHTSELQSRSDLVCRLLLEKKKKQINTQLQYTTS